MFLFRIYFIIHSAVLFFSITTFALILYHQLKLFVCFFKCFFCLFLFYLALLCRRHAVFRTVSFVLVIEVLKITGIFTESPKSQQFYALVGYLPSAVQKRLSFHRYILNNFILFLCCLLSFHSKFSVFPLSCCTL